jgi:hypothetical protein
MSARRHGRRRGTPCSARQAPTVSRTWLRSGQVDTSPSFNAKWSRHLVNWNGSSGSSETTLPSNQVSFTTYASTYVFAAQEEWNKLLSNLYAGSTADLFDNKPLYELFAEAPGVGVDEP